MSPKKVTKKSTKSTTKKTTHKAVKSTTAISKKSKGLTAEERAALKETLQERKGKGEGESVVLAKIAAMAAPDRALAQRVHTIVRASAPELSPRTWYGMPAYANKDGKVVCFFQEAAKFKARYATFGFNDVANLDEGAMWPVAFGLKAVTAAEEARISALVKKAVS
jgi:uncharacterized protein YdhG (YjbR/CyaY superfamily)